MYLRVTFNLFNILKNRLFKRIQWSCIPYSDLLIVSQCPYLFISKYKPHKICRRMWYQLKYSFWDRHVVLTHGKKFTLDLKKNQSYKTKYLTGVDLNLLCQNDNKKFIYVESILKFGNKSSETLKEYISRNLECSCF